MTLKIEDVDSDMPWLQTLREESRLRAFNACVATAFNVLATRNERGKWQLDQDEESVMAALELAFGEHLGFRADRSAVEKELRRLLLMATQTLITTGDG